MNLNKVHVVTSYFNPVRYKSRKKNHLKWLRYWKRSGIEPWVVEVQLGIRPFEVTEKDNPRHLQLRSLNELWHKEAALNELVKRLPRDWQVVVSSDNDVVSLQKGKKWLNDILHAHQSYEIVQGFQSALDLGPHGQTLHKHDGFVYSYLTERPFTRVYSGWHPGYCWSYTKKAWNAIGGLIDFAIVGAADDHMAKSLIGRGKDSLPTGLHPDYRTLVLDWEQQAKETKLDLGYVTHTIKHWFGGPKPARNYWGRWDILKALPNGDKAFSPIADIKRDWQGLWQLNDSSTRRRDLIRRYLRTRREDSCDIE